jgi:glutathione peroxidase
MLDRKMKRLDGSEEDLSNFLGKVVLIVNVASYCGNTPQYAGLQALYERYRERGFVVLGFPANEFGAQEPGTDAEIAAFCERNYGVTFPMFSKVKVSGPGTDPLFAELTSTPPGSPITWNFQKFLLGRDGAPAAMYAPCTEPQSREVISKIEELLG